MKAVVTGAGGFLGSEVCRVLDREGHQLIRMTRRAVPQENNFSQTMFLDLCDPKAADEIVSHRPDVMIHFAAAVPAEHVGSEAERVAEINRRIDATVIKALKSLRIKMIYASSLSVYGSIANSTMHEQSATNPPGPYAAAKLETEAVGEQLFREEGIGFIALRIGAPYGPGQRNRNVLKTFVENALQGLPLQYHGTGSRQQDFIHSLDVAEAVKCALVPGANGVYNVATGRPLTMKRLAQVTVASVPGCRSLVVPSGRPDPQEGRRADYSIEKIQKDLGWKPQVTLTDGIGTCAREWASRGLS